MQHFLGPSNNIFRMLRVYESGSGSWKRALGEKIGNMGIEENIVMEFIWRIDWR